MRGFPLLRRPSAPQPLDALAGYARWAATYEQDMDGHPLALAESGSMLALLPDCVGLVTLDAACGTGRYTRLLAEQGARLVIGVDQSAEMLERASLLVPQAGRLQTGRGRLARATSVSSIEYRVGNLLALPVAGGSCDLVIVALALAHLETAQLGQAFAELGRVLRPSGVLLISELHPFGALTGGRCRFEGRAGGCRQVYHIQTHTHLHEDYFLAASAAGLMLEALREPRLTSDLFAAFERAGMGEFARQMVGFPLALVCRWRAQVGPAPAG